MGLFDIFKKKKMVLDKKEEASSSDVSTVTTQNGELGQHKETEVTEAERAKLREMLIERVTYARNNPIINFFELTEAERANLDEWVIIVDAAISNGVCWDVTYLIRNGNRYFVECIQSTYGGWGYGPSETFSRYELDLKDKFLGFSSDAIWFDAVSKILDDEANNRLNKYTVFRCKTITCGPMDKNSWFELDEVKECLKAFEQKQNDFTRQKQ